MIVSTGERHEVAITWLETYHLVRLVRKFVSACERKGIVGLMLGISLR